MLNTLPEDYLDKLKLNVPDHLLKLLADCIRLFLTKVEIKKEKIDEITGKLYQRRNVDMFDVQFTVRDIERNAAEKAAKKATEKAAIKIAKKLLENGVPIEIISASTGLGVELIEQLEDDIDEGAVQPV